jgi:hypothetical protein
MKIYNPVADRHATVRDLLKNRKAASFELREQVQKQVIERGLEILETTNEVGVFTGLYFLVRNTLVCQSPKFTCVLTCRHRITESGTKQDALHSTSGKRWSG